jgi:hypothetical protein
MPLQDAAPLDFWNIFFCLHLIQFIRYNIYI